jgi:uncharacterized protein (TIGR02996 family)
MTDQEPVGRAEGLELQLQLAAVRDGAGKGVYADWLEDQGRPTEAAVYRGLAAVDAAREALTAWVGAVPTDESEAGRFQAAEKAGLYRRLGRLGDQLSAMMELQGQWWCRRRGDAWSGFYARDARRWAGLAAEFLAELPAALRALEAR